MTYIPKGTAAKEIYEVMGDLNTAQHQWNTLAEKLGEAYSIAYREHVKPLNAISESLRASSDKMYFVLSLFCVAISGGVAGGLMAPWVSRAGVGTSQAIRTVISESTQSVTGGVVQKVVEATKSNQGGAYTPAATEPLQYYQHMKGEIGVCFSALRDAIEEEAREADGIEIHGTTEAKELEYGRRRRQFWSEVPIVGDYPRTKDMPDVAEAAKQAELGMWITWANIRDIDYWKKVMKAMSNYPKSPVGKDLTYLGDAERLYPIVDRLGVLGYAQMVTREHPKANWKNVKYGDPYLVGRISNLLDIPSLALLGKRLGGNFYSRLDEVVKSSNNARQMLTDLTGVPPVWK